MKFSALINRAHGTAVAKGWHEGKQRSLDRALALLCLVHTEVAELDEELRTNGVADNIVEGKPLGPTAELADVLIRMADTFGFFGWTYPPVSVPDPTAVTYPLIHDDAALAREVGQLNAIVSRDFVEKIRVVGEPPPEALQAFLRAIGIVAQALQRRGGLPFLKVLEAKLTFNETRTIRHGGKLI